MEYATSNKIIESNRKLSDDRKGIKKNRYLFSRVKIQL